MKKELLYLVILLFFSFSLRAQFLQYGFQGGFYGKQTVLFNSPVILDPEMIYHDSVYALADNLQKEKENHPVHLDVYVNYRFNKKRYVGLNYKFLKHESYRNGIDDSYNPPISIQANALGIVAGYTTRKGLFDFFIEGGLNATRLRFKHDWNAPEDNVYSNYLNQKNTFLMGFGKIGFNLLGFSFSTRWDIRLADLINKSGIKDLRYTPTFNVGFDIRSGILNKKRYAARQTDLQLANDVSFKEVFEFPTIAGELGGFVHWSVFQIRDQGPYAYLYKANPVVVNFRKQFAQFNLGYACNLKFSPFQKKNVVFGILTNLSLKPEFSNAGSITTNTASFNLNSISTETRDLKTKLTSHQVGFGAGYQFKITDVTFIEIMPLLNLIMVNNQVENDELDGFFRWRKGFSNNFGLNLAVKRRHWGVAFKFSKAINGVELNDRFKAAEYYTISFFRFDVLKK